MNHEDLQIIDKINDFTIYSVGNFEDIVPTSSISLPQEFIQKIHDYCFDFNYAAVSLPPRFYSCPFCGVEVKESDLKVSKYSSNRIWLQLNQSIYSFPGILYHLIIVHNYIPPNEFIEVVLNPKSKTVLLFDKDARITRCNKETMEMLLAVHNSSKENVESRVMTIGDGEIVLSWKRPETLIDKVKRFFRKKS